MNIEGLQNPYEAAWQKVWGRPGEEAVLVVAPWGAGEKSPEARGVQGVEKTNQIAGDSDTVRKPGRASSPEECQTCKERKYQDGSDDPGVSFKTPTNVDPDMAASAVRGHEMEHVYREQAKAQRENREVVSQSVTYHTAICPECGKAFVSGGTTRTTTKANPAEEPKQAENEPKSGFEAVA